MSPRTTATLICVVLAAAYLAAAGPVFAATVFVLLGAGVFASLRFGAWVRQVTIVGGLVGLFFVFPSPTGDRRTPETGALGALAEIRSAQLAYNISTNYYDSLECLASIQCVRQVGFSDPVLKAELSGAEPWRGYRFVFHGGPAPSERPNEAMSRSAVTRFAVVAVPAGSRSGKYHSYCLDDTGSIYATPDAGVPKVEGGRCVDTSRPIK